MRAIIAICFVLFTTISSQNAISPTPIVMWHGMGDSCCNPLSLGSFRQFLEKEIPEVYVLSLQIGKNMAEDTENGFFLNVNRQVSQVCEQLANDPKLKDGYNSVGFSQGGQFLRGYVQRYNDPPVYNLITMGGQHQGVFGYPNCPALNVTMCEELRRLITYGAYEPEIQEHVVQAEYWQDPFHQDEYVNRSVFLADINNQGAEKNQTYKQNLMSLNQFVMVMFTEDTMVQPKQSEWFEFYAPGQDRVVVPLNESQIYTEDWLGLQQMDQQGQLQFIPCPGNHLQFTQDWFKQYIFPYIDSTINSTSAKF